MHKVRCFQGRQSFSQRQYSQLMFKFMDCDVLAYPENLHIVQRQTGKILD